MTDAASTGRCFCGNVRFQFNGEPLWIGHCHCNSCRRNTGAPVATFVGVAAAGFTVTAGERSIYDSSPGVRRGFCADCGTPLTYEAERWPDEVHIYLSVLDEPERFPAQFHVHYEERIGWFQIDDQLPRHDRTSSRD